MQLPYAESIWPYLANRPRGTGSAMTSDPITMANFQSLLVLVGHGRAGAANDFTVSLETREEGSAWRAFSKPINWYRATGSGGGGINRAEQYVRVFAASAEVEGDHDGMLWAEVLGTDLPAGHNQVRVATSASGSNNKESCIMGVLLGARYSVPVDEAAPR